MKVIALIPFNGYGYIKDRGEVFEIEDSGVRLDLEKIGFIQPYNEPKKKTKEKEQNRIIASC